MQQPAFGGFSEKKLRVSITGEGAAINVFRTGEPYISNNPGSDPRIWKQMFEMYPTRNMIIIPLEYNLRRIGVLHIANKKMAILQRKMLSFYG